MPDTGNPTTARQNGRPVSVQGEILVLGVGNYLMGDEGVGVHIAQQMEKMPLPGYLHVVDGGTGGFFLMNYFDEYPVVILADATMDGRPPGTIRLIEPRFAADFPSALSVHDVGLKDMIEALYLSEKVPKMYLFTISIDHLTPMTIELSPAVAASVPVAIERILNLAAEVHKQITTI